MSEFDEPEEMEPVDIPPLPVGAGAPVTFTVPMPSVDQVVGEVARQLLRETNYVDRADILKQARREVSSTISLSISASVEPIIRELLSKPVQPTDNFGNPVGEVTTLHGVLGKAVTDWAGVPVDSEGKPTSPSSNHGKKGLTRMEWTINNIVQGEMRRLVDLEVAKIAHTLRGAAAAMIAKRVTEGLSEVIAAAR